LQGAAIANSCFRKIFSDLDLIALELLAIRPARPTDFHSGAFTMKQLTCDVNACPC